MLSPLELYPLVLGWLQAMAVTPHPTASAALAHLLTALLVGQSLRPSALGRALLATEAVPARQRYKRVARAWERAWLAPGWLTARLVPAALGLMGAERLSHLALDSVRCGRWEIYTLGLVWHGRALPVGWAVLRYPLPKGAFGPTLEALLRSVAAAWPGGRAAHLVADRAFPSGRLFRLLDELGWGYTVRVRATDGVRVGGQTLVVRDLLAGAAEGAWTACAATFGSGRGGVAGTLVVGRGLVVLPAHQRGPGSLRARGRQQARRQQHLATKQRGGSAGLRATDPWVALFTTHRDWRAAEVSYRRRWAIEGSYRDAQGGWDGQHGWDLEPVVAAQDDPDVVATVVGLWALGALVQCWIGDRVGRADAPSNIRAVVGQWTTSGRLSVWARGKLALAEPSGRLRGWLALTLADGARRLATVPTAPNGALDPCQLPRAA